MHFSPFFVDLLKKYTGRKKMFMQFAKKKPPCACARRWESAGISHGDGQVEPKLLGQEAGTGILRHGDDRGGEARADVGGLRQALAVGQADGHARAEGVARAAGVAHLHGARGAYTAPRLPIVTTIEGMRAETTRSESASTSSSGSMVWK